MIGLRIVRKGIMLYFEGKRSFGRKMAMLSVRGFLFCKYTIVISSTVK